MLQLSDLLKHADPLSLMTKPLSSVKPKGNGCPSVPAALFLAMFTNKSRAGTAHGASAKMDDDKTTEDKAFLKSFKFVITKPSFHKRGNPQDSKQG